MAYAYKKKGTWYLGYQDENGRAVQQASKAKTRAEALRLAQANERFEEQVRDGVTARTSNLTLGQLFEKWSASKGELAAFDSDEGRWRNHLAPDLEDLPMRQLTGADLEALLIQKLKTGTTMPDGDDGKGRGKRKQKPLSTQTVAHLRRLVSRLYNWAIAKDLWSGKNPAAMVELPQIAEKVPITAEASHVHALLAAAEEPYRTAFAIAIYAGLRSAEILGLEASRVNLTAGVLLIERTSNRESTKSGKYRVLPIVPELRPYLERTLSKVKTGALVDMRQPGGAPFKWPKGHLLNVLHQTMARAGIPAGLTVHALRHTYISQLSMSGADPRAVQALAGHSDMKTTARYIHLRDSYLVQQAGKLSYAQSDAQQVTVADLPGTYPASAHSRN